MAPNSFQTFTARVDVLGESIRAIPTSVAVATKKDAIFTLFEKIPIPQGGSASAHFEVFNRRMDLLFGEDVRDKATQRLLNVKRGPQGMDLVFKYINEATDTGCLVWDIAQIKVDRLIKEIEKLWYVNHKYLFHVLFDQCRLMI